MQLSGRVQKGSKGFWGCWGYHLGLFLPLLTVEVVEQEQPSNPDAGLEVSGKQRNAMSGNATLRWGRPRLASASSSRSPS